MPYRAIVHYDTGFSREVTSLSDWYVSAPEYASIHRGQLTARDVPPQGVDIGVKAAFVESGARVSRIKDVRLIPLDFDDDDPYSWETHQGNRRHDGYVPLSYRARDFELRWQVPVGPGRRLNPVAAGDQRVFVSLRSRFDDDTQLFALDSRDGVELWSRALGPASSINPPALSDGKLFIQTAMPVAGFSGSLHHARRGDG